MSEAVAVPVERARFDDRLNPILIKEVRQALRGRYFRWLFWVTLLVATLIGLMIISTAAADENASDVGQGFFLAMFGCLAFAVHGFVPFWAFLSTSAEWDENTYDLLVISNLRPRQIVRGKLLSALVQALLYYSTFAPFLAFAFILSGIDLFSVAVILIASVATCTALSTVGIALSSLAHAKMLRVVLMALFAAALTGFAMFTIGMAFAVTESPQNLRDIEGQSAVALYLSAAFVIGVLASAIAVARFSHEEENRSTPMRIVSVVVILAASAWGAWSYHAFRDHEFAWGAQIVAACGSFLIWLFAVSEPEELGRRVRKHLPRPAPLALLAAPFLPGGGRGMWLFLLNFATALVGGQVALLFGPSSGDDRLEVIAVTAVVYGYAALYLGLPFGIMAFFVRTPRTRALARVFVFVAVPLSMVLPMLAGLFLRIRPWMEGEHPLNPFWVIHEVQRSRRPPGVALALAMLVLGGLLTLLLNSPRMFSGLRELSVAPRSTERAETEP